jgi:putative ABC transport system permease protein
MVAAVRAEVARVDPEVAASSVRPMAEALAATLAPRRFNLLLVGTFAVVALGLAVTGLYTVTAQLVTRRTREIGIRIALGARPRQVLRLVLRSRRYRGRRSAPLGALPTAWATARQSIVRRGPHRRLHVRTEVALVATALPASYLPAWRALRVDPMTAYARE